MGADRRMLVIDLTIDDPNESELPSGSSKASAIVIDDDATESKTTTKADVKATALRTLKASYPGSFTGHKSGRQRPSNLTCELILTANDTDAKERVSPPTSCASCKEHDTPRFWSTDLETLLQGGYGDGSGLACTACIGERDTYCEGAEYDYERSKKATEAIKKYKAAIEGV